MTVRSRNEREIRWCCWQNWCSAIGDKQQNPYSRRSHPLSRAAAAATAIAATALVAMAGYDHLDGIPDGEKVRASHMLIKHEASRNPLSRRTNESTANYTQAEAAEEMKGWTAELKRDERPMAEKFAALAAHRSDCGSFQNGGDLGFFGPGEMQSQFEKATWNTPIGEVSEAFESDSGLHIVFRTA